MSPTIMQRESQAIPDGLLTLSPILQRILASRGVTHSDELKCLLTDLLQPDTLMGLASALARLTLALENEEHILIVGDFDADGATSTAVAVRLLRDMGAKKVSYLVPNRLTCGYGLTPKLLALAQPLNPDLIITVDNGIASVEGVRCANDAGIDVLVTDHHLPGEVLPNACAIVNPNQLGCAFPSKMMAGVGVIFYLMIALRKHLQALGWFEKKGLPAPNLAQVLDIVALGTVADVVPLDRNNRILVAQGLQRMRALKACPGIRALFTISGRDPSTVVAQDLGFALGPRLNAAGRLEDMSIGIACLLAETDQEAMRHALVLDDLNKKRKTIEGDMSAKAFEAVDRLELSGDMPLGVCVHEANWHQGVVGLVASRVKERLSRPVIAFACDGQGSLKGSARSIPGFHIRDALVRIAARHPELMGPFGGHAMAAGLAIKRDNFDAFCKAFAVAAADELTPEDCTAVIHSDGELAPADMTLAFAQELREIPWGQGFPEPVFEADFNLVAQRQVGDGHLKLSLSCPGDDGMIDGIWFRADMDDWLHQQPTRVRVIFRLDVNAFRGQRRLQLMVLTMIKAS